MADSTKEPPLVDIKVTNPITYLKRWWQKVIGNEGVNFSFKIHPLTAIAMAAVISVVAFGVGRYSINLPFLKYEVVSDQTPAPTETWKETAFTGTLQHSGVTKKYFLQVTSSSEAITLQVTDGVDLKSLVGKRIFALGSYSKSARTLIVADAKDMEILPKSPLPVPTIAPTPSPSPTTAATSTPEGLY